MRNSAGVISFLLRCYISPRPNGPDWCTPVHARSQAMLDWLQRFKEQGLIQSDIGLNILIQGRVNRQYLTDKGVAFVKAICDLDPGSAEYNWREIEVFQKEFEYKMIKLGILKGCLLSIHNDLMRPKYAQDHIDWMWIQFLKKKGIQF